MSRKSQLSDAGDAAASGCVARFLDVHDLDELVSLEREKWGNDQAASRNDFIDRIVRQPRLGVGAFHPRTGHIIASLFMKPVAPDFWKHAGSWRECVDSSSPRRTPALFGISLSSRRTAGVDAILEFFWPYALGHGWRHIYLGSPVPGWREWHRAHPQGSVDDYVAQTRDDGLPRDPQLRYYQARGFDRVVCIKPGYFPHQRSEDHGVILRGAIPLARFAPMWRALPIAATRGITRRLSSLLA